MRFVDKINKVTAGKGYGVHIELEEEGSTDYITLVKLPKKVVEGLKMLPKNKLAQLKKELTAVFTKIAQEK
jgi:hypothetical protein